MNSARLIATVERAYGVAAKLAHREPTLERTAAIWARTVAICDHAIARRKGSIECNLQRILELRAAAECRRDLHS